MTCLYKYVTAPTCREILKNRTLRWSTPPTLNDPFDMQLAFQLRTDREAALAMALDKTWQLISGQTPERPLNVLGRYYQSLRGIIPTPEELRRRMGDAIAKSIDKTEKVLIDQFNTVIVKEHFEGDKILCLSETPDIILMWSYYSANHTGVVLCFTDETSDNPIKTARKVEYVDEMPSLMDDDGLSDLLAGYKTLDAGRIMDLVIYNKSKIWSHEKEWRIYSGAGRSPDPFEYVPFNAKELDALIFGARTTNEDRTVLTDLVRKHYAHAKILQARVRTDLYGLAIEPAEL